MRTLDQCRLYGILDAEYCAADQMVERVVQLVRGGVDLVQLRAKQWPEDRIRELAAELHPRTKEAGVPLILNDYPGLVGETGVEGAHVGVEDMTVAEARALAGVKCWIGKSSHSVEQAQEGERTGADYLGFGPLFATPTKPDYLPIGMSALQEVHRKVRVPVFCIGGIKLDNLQGVLEAGARRVVIVSGLLQATNPEVYAAECRKILASQGFQVEGGKRAG